jgi:hypothetical protein
MPKIYSDLDTRTAFVTEAVRATYDPERGPEAKAQCGLRVWRRTVVVYLHFPREEPSASLSQGVVFVRRAAPERYLVWEKVH